MSEEIAIKLALTAVLIVGFIWFLRRILQKPEAAPSEVVPVQTSLLVPDLPDDLVEACASGNCVLYAGAGLAAQASYPTWNKFVHQLLSWALENGFLDRHVIESYRAEINAGAADSVADSIISKLPADARKDLYDYMRSVFLRKVKLPQAYELLKDLNFSAVLTTNFDDLLEHTLYSQKTLPLYYTYQHTEELLSALTTRKFFILKLYGTLARPETVLVAPAQLEEAISTNREFLQFMDTLFFSRTLLFVGASLEGIEAYLKSVTLPQGTNRTHYALVAVTDNAWRAKADTLQRRYGIQVLPYTPSTRFPEVVEFLTKLSDQVKARALQPARPTRTEGTARLQRVVLQNIGPFEHLDLDLNEEWNILLGDNGVGKSTILKAISVALLGERAQPWAGRLIKSGSTESFITLETTRGIGYKTTLRRTRKGYDEAEVVSEQARLLETEGWLALGFPPLRITNWQRIKGPDTESPGRSRPTPDDLLPLIKGEPDPRLDNLKQWIVNMDYWGAKNQGRNQVALTEKLFDLINLLTHPLKTTFRGVDGDGHVRVETEHDGPVPIEAISQGLSSLIGWVGVLLQRLYEIHTQDQNPLEKYALVLMDELDAHMHPAWQQALVPRLKEVFKNTQFIATTHSPLVAMGLAPEQVRRFMRDEDGHIVQLDIEPDMTMGRADQVLTGELFSVSSARDLETQALIDRYSELAARENLEKPEQKELAKLANDLKIRMPSPAQRKEARIAYEWITETLKQRIDALPPEEQQKVITEMKVQLQEIVTGSWRPQ